MEAKKVERVRIQQQKSQLRNRKQPTRGKEKLRHEEAKHRSKSYSFTEEEIKLFEIRFDNGYDLTTDERYNAWLRAKGDRDNQLSASVSLSEIDDPPYSFDDSMFDISL